MTEVGRMLEEARLKKGVTLDKVENELKIRKHYLLAMEAGHWEELPGYAYATGFLRSYGDYLGLSGEDLVEEYKYWRKTQGIDTIAEDVPVGVFTRAKELQTDTGIFQLSAKDQGRTRRRRKAQRGLVVAIILVVAFAAYLFLTWKQPFSDIGGESIPSEEVHIDYEVPNDTGTISQYGASNDTSDAIPGEALNEVADSIPGTIAEMPTEKTAGAKTVQEVDSKTGEGAHLGLDDMTDVVFDLEKQRAESQTGEIERIDDTILPDEDIADLGVEITLPSDTVHRLPPVEVGDDEVWPVTLEATTTGRCWVEVRCDGQLLASRTLEAGEHHTWRASEELKVRFGNASVVELTLNGKPIGSAGKGVTTRVFTRDSEVQD